MSRIDELIKEKCPDGVEYKTLGETCEIKTGAGITKKDATEDGTYPIISGGIEPLGMYNRSNRKAKTVTIARAGGAGYVNYIEADFYLNDKCFSIIPTGEYSNFIDSRFLYFVLKNMEKDIMDMKSTGSVPTVNTQKVAKIKIPIPPLEIQQEIVGILNSFTELEAELEAELAKRKKQYEHYRDHLLSFENLAGEGGQVEWLTLGDIGEVCMCKRILKNQTKDSGIPFFKIGTFGKKEDSYIAPELFEEYKNKYSYPKKGDILISAAGTIGRTVVFDGEPAYFQDSNIVWIDNDEGKVTNRYLYYFYQTKPWRVSSGGTIARIYNDDIRSIKIPVPTRNIQERIVYVLDNFDAVCNDLKIGLPAEIEARQKQYEYYRDRLLSFDVVVGGGTEREREREE